MRCSILAGAACSLALLAVLAAGEAQAQDRARTWEFNAGLQWSDSLSLGGEEGTGLEIDDDLGFTLGGTYNFTNRLALGFDFGWLSPRYDATFLPEGGPPYENIRARLDAFTIAGKGTFNFLEGPITPYVELGFGWTNVDSNIADGPPVTGCWWDPWWGYICAPFFSTYSENLTSWSAALGVRWDINRMWGMKASYGVLELDTSSRLEDASLDMFKIEAVFRY
jgi:opacity protein-like surface antigen